MFPKLVTVKTSARTITYLRLIEKYYEEGKKKDRVIANLGRQDIEGRRNLGKLLKSLRKFTDEVLVTPEEIESKRVLEYGSVLVIKKLWDEIGLGKWIKEKCTKKIDGNLGEAGILAMVCNRLLEPRSELGLCEWLEGVYCESFDKRFREGKIKSRAESFYRTLDWLIEGKAKIEEEIYQWVRTLFPVDVVFYDITNIQFEGEGPQIARRGYAKLGKRNHKQVLLGLIMVEGLPVAHYVFRGNRGEKTTIKWISKDVKRKFNVGRIIFVMDRGMISTMNLEEIEKQDNGYIAGMKRRRNNETKELIETGESGFEEIKEGLLAKEVEMDGDGKRRIICINPDRAKEDKEKRELIMQELEGELIALKEKIDTGKIRKQKVIVASCEKILNKKHGKRYFNYEVGKGKFEFYRNEKNIEYEEKLDGKFMIKSTEKTFSLKEIVMGYKDLMNVEKMFRDLKDFIEVAPVYHQANRRVRAHIFVCVLALLIQKYIEKKLANARMKISAQKVLSKLKTIKVVINQVGELNLKYVIPPAQELSRILRVFDIQKLPRILSDISKETASFALQKAQK